MDLTEPASGLAGGLTIPVLRALSQRSSPVTAAQLYRVSREGTEAGVRRAIERLARHGILVSEQVGDRTVYSLNYDHVLHTSVVALLRARDELPRRLRKELSGWRLAPVAAALYGSAARGDGDVDSDIDVLIIRPSMSSTQQREIWAMQVHRLRDEVRRWTGNRCQVTDRTRTGIERLVRARAPIVDDWRVDAINLAGIDVDELLGEP